MAFSLHNQQRVFLTYRSLFKGQTALVRKRKKIQQLVQTHQKSSKTLIKEIGLDNVVVILKTLLERGVFSSEMKAKAAFPLVFQTTAVQDKQHAASEAGALEEEAREFEKIKGLEMNGNVGEGENVNGNAGVGVDMGVNGTGSFDAGGSGDVVEWEDVEEGFVDHQIVNEDGGLPHNPIRNAQFPSLYPLYIPYRTQHQILTKVQRLLEEGCFEFSSKWTPDLLARKEWDCSEAIELNQWIDAMRKSFGKLPADALGDISGAKDVFFSVNKLRHSAVHRLRLTVRGIKDIIHKAMVFTATLRDTERESQLNELYLELQRTIRSLELHKNFLETRLQEEFDEIHKLRKELSKREKDAKARTLREDGENNSMAGSLLEELLKSILDKASQEKSSSGGEEDVEKTDEEEVLNDGPEPELELELEHQHKTQVHGDPEVQDEVPLENPEPETASGEEVLNDELEQYETQVHEDSEVQDEVPLENPEPERASGEEVSNDELEQYETQVHEDSEVQDEVPVEQPELEGISDQEIPGINVPDEPEEEPEHWFVYSSHQKMNGQAMQEGQDADAQPVGETWLDHVSPYGEMVSMSLPMIKIARDQSPDRPVEQEDEAYPEEIQQEPDVQPDSPGYEVPEAVPFEQPPEEVLPTLSMAPPPLSPPIEFSQQVVEPEAGLEQEVGEPVVAPPPPEWLAQRLATNGEHIDGSASVHDARILLNKLITSVTALRDFKGKKKSMPKARLENLMGAATDIYSVLNRHNADE